MELASFIIACTAFAFSVFTFLFYDNKLKKQERKLNEYQLKKNETEEVEFKKAQIRGNIVKGEKGRRTLKVFNAGKASATNIRLEFLCNTDGLFGSKNPFPYELLNPQDSTEAIFHLTVGCPDTLKVKYTWDDEFQKNNEFTQVLTL
ncbi:MAG: hypothetical protein IJC16_05805 [Rikenellaceae bacterium]|nr:hypothetical protein [Rikenellaceae bacterium]